MIPCRSAHLSTRCPCASTVPQIKIKWQLVDDFLTVLPIPSIIDPIMSMVSRSIGHWELPIVPGRRTLMRATACHGIADGLKKAGAVLSLVEPAAFQCTNSKSVSVHFTNAQTCRWFLLTSLSIAFSGECRLNQHQVVHAICAMTELKRLEILGAPSPDTFFGALTRHPRLTLNSFSCDSDVTESLLDFLATQPQLSECAVLSNPKNTIRQHPRQRTEPMLSNVVLLRTTAQLLNHTQLDLSSVRRLEYIGDSLDISCQIGAIDRICQIGAQLETLRFTWGTGKVETFLDVTKFFKMATCMPSIRYLQLVNVDKDAFEQFIESGLRARRWNNLETLVWVPATPWVVEKETDTLGSDGRSIISLSSLRKLWKSSDSSDCSLLCSADRDLRIHHIGREVMEENTSMRRFVIWNWSRKRYDMLSRSGPDSVGTWSYGVDLKEHEWMTI